MGCKQSVVTVTPLDEPSKVNALSLTTDGLDANNFRSITLSKIHEVNHNTKLFTFTFDDPKSILNMKISSCTVLKANIDGEDVYRPYTPTTRPNTQGYLEFLIKYYPQVPKYDYQPHKFKSLTLIAGGTGLTPMLQMIEEVLFNADDTTTITLLYANTSFADILIKGDLDKLAQKYYDRFKCYYTISSVADTAEDQAWTGERGHITTSMLEKLIPMPSNGDDESIMVMVCGPPGFMRLICGEKTPDYKQGEVSGLLKQVGFTEKNVFKF
ncbi:unnamed protein product [Didymodactylos carnosus]|uniref:cytochrome-b5 reductase n=1 Tax=Didymodactylos carnosus TaxID=1234261 RepID=A0A814DPU0_9BILA|nr:unnamed protein product [Didymodactylos carnosus]CAF1209694.1 unnamed protein product [Didymodactylos carnosus]CAF3732670.1 unnamed protein product [Didymodactylos carnosus]CAF4018752.1 unnamed protein product [Didymodactylos carnosus]